MTTIKAGRKHGHAARFPNSELKPHGHADPRGHEAGRAQGERARHSVPPSGFWLQGADSQQVTPTQGSHAGLRQIWGPPSLSPSLPGPAQKPKDTSASDNEWFILFRVLGEKSRGLPPHPAPAGGITHTHAARDGHRGRARAPASGARRRCTWKPQKNNRAWGEGVTVVAAKKKTPGRESEGMVLS